MLSRPRKSLRERLKETVGMFSFGGGFLGLIGGGIGTIVTALFTGIPFLAIPTIGAAVGATYGLTKLGIIITVLVACAGSCVPAIFIGGLILGALIGIGYGLYKHFSQPEEQDPALQAVSAPLIEEDSKARQEDKRDRSNTLGIFQVIDPENAGKDTLESSRRPPLLQEDKENAQLPVQSAAVATTAVAQVGAGEKAGVDFDEESSESGVDPTDPRYAEQNMFLTS